MSSTRTYQAYTMAEALAAVKYDLGSEAIILGTRTFKRGGLLGLGRRTVVEVTASSESPKAPSKPAKQGNVAAGKAYGEAKTSALNGSAPTREAAVQALAGEADRQRAKRLAMVMQERHRRSAIPTAPAKTSNAPQSSAPVSKPARAAPHTQPHSLQPASPLLASMGAATPAAIPLEPVARLNHTPQPAANPHASLVVTVPATPMSVAAKRFILRSPGPDRTAVTDAAPAMPSFQISEPTPLPPISATPVESTPAGIVSIGAPPPSAPGYAAPMRSPSRLAPNVEINPNVQVELAAIKQMVGQVLQRQTTTTRQHTPSMPPRLFDLYLRLVGHDLSDDLAEAMVSELRERLSPQELENEAALRHAAVDALADHIPVAPTSLSQTAPAGGPLTIALVGPTGVGKTTTLAKLAASFKLKAGRKVGLITSDTYRIAAVDQLRTYANIIGLPLHVVLTSGDMRQAVADLSDHEVVLIDTAGRSQNDAMRIAELREFIDAARPHETHMVLSATAGEKVLANEAAAFGRVGVDRLILTKLDEAASLGGVVGLLRQLGKPVSFITTGQEVPDDLEPAQARRLAELVLGGIVRV